MRTLMKIAACLAFAGAAGAAAQEPVRGGSAERAALEAFARTRVAEMIESKAVRPGDPARTAAEADMIAEALADEELRAIAAGGDVETITAPAIRKLTADALGDGTSHLTFVPLPPCRIIDTRSSGAGKMNPLETRFFQVAGFTEFPPQGGNMNGCGVPPGTAIPVAAAVMINLVAVEAEGGGNMLAWPFGQPMPNASSLNFQRLTPGMNVANGLIVPIAGTTGVDGDILIQARQNRVHVVADVTGYFTRFPIEQFEATEKTITEISDGGVVDLASMPPGCTQIPCCLEVNSCTITSGAAGRVIVRTWAQIKLNHGTNVGGDRIAVGVKNVDPTTCSNNDQSINATDYEVPDSLPADADIDWTLSHKRIFVQPKGTRTYYINAKMITGVSAGDEIEASRMICTFIPD